MGQIVGGLLTITSKAKCELDELSVSGGDLAELGSEGLGHLGPLRRGLPFR